MIGTIRKHSKWLWVVIITLTVISFIYWGAAPAQRGGNGRAGGDFGSVYGQKITQQEFVQAFNEFKLFYLFNYGTWPDKKAAMSQKQMDQATYERLLLVKKADDLGIHVGLDVAAAAADKMLRSLGRNGQTVTADEFEKQVLQPEGLTVADFEDFARHDIAIQQLVQSVGSSGALITPQEAAAIYQHEHQELASQIIFFSAKNYLPSVTVAPEAVGQFYTNYLAEYRLPDRVQVSYVAFELSNYPRAGEDGMGEDQFRRAGGRNLFPIWTRRPFLTRKLPPKPRPKSASTLIRQRALADARAQANDFAGAVFNLEPARAENLATVAKQKGLTVRTTAPFAAETGPQEFAAPEAFTKTAFGLTPDEPFANPIASTNAIYVIALARQLPSEIPALADIRTRVTQDFQMQQAVVRAREAGTNFLIKLKINMAVGKSFRVRLRRGWIVAADIAAVFDQHARIARTRRTRRIEPGQAGGVHHDGRPDQQF